MEQDGPINFKALRAKFQEEATLAQAKNNRPTIPEKPRHVPPPGGHCGSLPNGRNHAVENKTQAVPRVIFRSDLRSSVGKRPISFPPQTSPRTQARNGDHNMAAMHSSLEGHLPLVLPARPKPNLKEPPLYSTSSAKEPQHPMEPPTEPPTETLSSTAAKKMGLLLPFKASKPPKGTPAGGEEAAYATYLPTGRPASAPGELPSPRGPDEACPHGEDGHLSSPDAAVTPPSREANGDSDHRLMSTLERAKKKFSRKQVLMYVKGKSAPSPEDATASQDAEGVEADFPAPSPVCLSQLACVSARPFFTVDKASRQMAWDKQLATDRCGRPDGQLQPLPPPLRSLVEVEVLGPVPAKPPRPPCVDLGLYRPAQASPDLSRPPAKDPAPDQSTASTPLLDAPDFPDFEPSSSGGPEDPPPLDIASLEAEEFINFDLPPPADPETSYFEAAPEGEPSDPASFDLQAFMVKLNPDGPEDPLAAGPSGLPEPPDLSSCPLEPAPPESCCCAEDAAGPPAVPEHGTIADPRTTGSYLSEEAGRAGHAALANRIEVPASPHQQDDDLGTCDNVYEDVETINRYLSSQNSQKSKDPKGGPKNPYGDSQQAKEEVRLNIWPRNPWGNLPGEHGHSAHPHFHRDRAQSPDHGEHKEQKKKERQRQEKEKKEQKEQEKRKTEMKKKFKVTGAEEPLYHAKVMVATKVRKKNDLLVTSGDTVSIIRTTNCPKGRWLARDAGQKYGYISVMNVELNIKEMLELGKKAQAAGRGGNANPNADADTVSISSRSSNYPALHSSFTDDSEEWACEDEILLPSAESHSFHHQTVSMPDMMCSNASSLHTLSDANLEDLHTQTRHEALQKLVTFFQHNEGGCGDATGSSGVTPTNLDPPSFLCAVEEPPHLEREVDFTHLELLPPPPLYADTF